MTKKEQRTYRAYLVRKHSRLVTPKKVIDRAVYSATGALPVSKKRLLKGEANEVWDILTKNGKAVIVRISHKGYPRSFEDEARIIKRCLKKGIPAPKVLLTRITKLKGKTISICIEEKLEGRSLDMLLGTLGKAELKKIVRGAGRILSLIHSIRLSAYGWVGKRGRENFGTWKEWILMRLTRHEKTIPRIARRIGVPEKNIREALDILHANQKLFTCGFPHLVHKDFGPKHIMVKGGKIVGIIDFENHIGGDPIYEFARYALFHEWEVPIEWLIDGYADKKVFRGDFQKKFLLYKLELELTHLGYYFREKNPAGIGYIKKVFAKDLVLYKRRFPK